MNIDKIDHPHRAGTQRTYNQLMKDGMFKNLPDDYDPPLWDPERDEDFELDEAVMFLGQRRSGKSTMAMDIALRYRRLYPIIFVFTGTKHNGYWQQVVPDDKIVEGLDEALLEKILALCAEKVQLYKVTKKQEGSATGNPYVLIINEDLLSGGLLRRSKSTQDCVFKGRHFFIASWTLTQDFVGMDRAERKSIDRYIIFRAFDPGTRQLIRETWGDKVLMIFDNVTKEPFQALVINNKTGTPLERVLLKYKADIEYVDASLHKNLHLGNELQWETTDLEEQKLRYPQIKMPAKETLKARFNQKVGETEIEIKPEPEAVSLATLGGDEHKLNKTILKETAAEEEAKSNTSTTMWN